MVDADDVQGYQRKYDNQMEKLEAADIDDADRDAIGRWVVHLRTNDSDVDSLGTVVGHLNRMRLAAERAGGPVTGFESVEDVNAFKLRLEDHHGLSEGTIRNYMKALRKFCQWRDVDWADDVTVGPSPERKHDPDEELTPEDVDALLDACSNARDRAMLALLDDTGLRIGAILSFQMCHVNFEQRRSTLTINEEANVKGDDGPKALTWSRAYVANWLAEHPRPDIPSAALIHKTSHYDDSEDGALTQQYAASRITDIAERAGLSGERVHAHLFRGSAISRWIRDQQSEQVIKHRVGWGKDSREFETYSRVTDEELNDVVFNHYDIGEDDDSATPRHRLSQCPSCKDPLRGSETFCPSCAHALTDEVALEVDDIEDDTFESASNADEERPVESFAEFRERFDSSAAFRREVMEGTAHGEPASSED
ncbi:tyrosine-type recombinase/integrase [Halomarina salina]|uniref:Tyrosine-type recombinase/integrase n=2 Tax=Halomarina salina TaxID=1872699 RepID=A0ABD5RHL8_9EURY